MNKNRVKIVVSTGIIACVIFAGIIAVERGIINSTPKKRVYIAVQNIRQGELLKANDFEIEEREGVTSDMLTSFDNIDNKYATENIYKGEPLNKNRVADKNDSSKIYLKNNEKEISIPVNKLNNDAFAGTLRRDDIVDICHIGISTQGDPISKSELVGKKIRVLGAVDSQGKFLEPKDRNALASSIMFAGNEKDFLRISEDLSSGYFTIAKSSFLK